MTVPETESAPGRAAALLKRIAGDREGVPTSLAELRDSETAKAAGLAVAMIANNVVALASTVVFARLLSDYGSLAALISYFLILSVVGQAHAGGDRPRGRARPPRRRSRAHRHDRPLDARPARSSRRSPPWSRSCCAHRSPPRSASRTIPWAAAVGLPAAVLWLELSILRGALQGVGDYKSVGVSLVGEQTVRLITGAILAAAGLGVTGAYLGTPLSFIAIGLWCMRQLHRQAAASRGGAARRRHQGARGLDLLEPRHAARGLRSPA